jgi:hypothetical protein
MHSLRSDCRSQHGYFFPGQPEFTHQKDGPWRDGYRRVPKRVPPVSGSVYSTAERRRSEIISLAEEVMLSGEADAALS